MTAPVEHHDNCPMCRLTVRAAEVEAGLRCKVCSRTTVEAWEKSDMDGLCVPCASVRRTK